MTRSRKGAELLTAYESGGLGSFKNRIINGAMMIDQRNAGALVSNPVAVGGYCLDRHAVYCSSGTNRFSVQRVSDAPVGFIYSQKITVTNAGTPAISDENRTYHGIEGQNLQDFAYGTSAAATSTLSFWVKTSVAGTYGVSLYNASASKSYVMTYTVNAANTWEYKTLTFGGDTSTAMATDNSGGLYLRFDLGNGTNYNAAAGSWVSGNFTRTSGCVTLSANSGATWQVTGVQLEKGSTATSFDYRPYGTEEILCKRYYERLLANYSFDLHVPNGAYLAHAIGTWQFSVAKRSAPTVGYIPGVSPAYDRYGVGVTTPSTTYFWNSIITSVNINPIFSNNLNQGERISMQATQVEANAEL